MSKAKCEPIKLAVDSRRQLQELIGALIDDYDIYIKQVKVDENNFSGIYATRYEVSLYERNKDEL